MNIRFIHQQRGWFSERWLGWKANNSLTDLHPVNPEAFKGVAVQPLLRLTPALRTLHLNAKKGRDHIEIAVKTHRERKNPLSSALSSSSSEGEAEAHRDDPRQPDAETFSDECFDGKGGEKWKTQHRGGDGPGERVSNYSAAHQQRVEEGCETKVVTRWTERQRIMCLIPDLGGRTESQ